MSDNSFHLSDLTQMASRISPLLSVYRLLRARWLRRMQPVRWRYLRRVTPISDSFGFHRGRCLDRYYIEHFLRHHQNDIHGRVLEILDPQYTKQFGGTRVTQSDVLHAAPGNPQATLVGDLATGEGIPQGVFDCLIITQTLHLIYDIHSAVANCYASLKPGGVLLATFPGICQISRYDADRWGDYWRLTSLSARRAFGDVFSPENLDVKAHGNVLVAVAYLHGLAVEELSPRELNHHDPNYEIVITVRAVRPHD